MGSVTLQPAVRGPASSRQDVVQRGSARVGSARDVVSQQEPDRGKSDGKNEALANFFVP